MRYPEPSPMPAAARVNDPHSCPLSSPLPHVGGVITGPGAATVIIGYQPAAVFGDSCTCASGPPNAVTGASSSVQVGRQYPARVGDATFHGGTILAGDPSVLIGD